MVFYYKNGKSYYLYILLRLKINNWFSNFIKKKIKKYTYNYNIKSIV